jgi:voltage-gated potassium channel
VWTLIFGLRGAGWEGWRRGPTRKLALPIRLLVFCSVPAVLVAGGTLGYHWIEGWTWFYSLYVTVITLTSIGYGEKQPFSTSGRVFTVVLALGGTLTVGVAATEVLGLVITGQLRDYWERLRMRRRIEALQQHVIVCGYGHVGRHVCTDLLDARIPVVVIDRREEALAAAHDGGAHPVLGDATADATLGRAGIARARALVAVAGTDPDNVLITMSARLLRPSLPIVARAEEQATMAKLVRAGATLTVSPHALAGERMAQAVLRPAVFGLIEEASGRGHAALQLEEQLIRPGSPLDGKTVRESGLRSGRGLILVAIKRPDGQLAFNPDDDAPVAAGDTLIMMASRAGLGRADALALTR